MSLLQVFVYLSLIFVIVGTIYRAVKLAGMPLHLRWDLYPIPHEKGRDQYGGSYFEDVDWWTKPTNSSTANELKEMGKEIFLIQSLFHNNRPLWIFSFPFHGGLYLLVAYLVFLMLGAILQAVGSQVSSSGSTIGAFVYYATIALGKIGLILGVVGACGLLLTRVFNSSVRTMSARADYFNLILLLAVFVTGIISFVKVDPDFNIAREFTASLLTFGAASPLPAETAVHLWLAGVFFIYLPFTHMMHFVGKYFTYHKVRWEDHPNIRGSRIEETISKALGYKIQWSADHIKTGSTWAEAATDVPTREDKQ